MVTEAELLIGKTIENGWTISKKIEKPSDETGGHFSVQYIAERGDEQCFLKAVDIQRAIFGDGTGSFPADFTKVLQEQMDSYEYEKTLLEYCKNHATSKIVLIKESGVIRDGSFPVPYLTFDLADGNVKHYVKFQNDLDFAWKLQSLHDIANGLQQLHNIHIIHQDVKPSNILQFKDESKLTDLGRSKCPDLKGPYDGMVFSGDIGYAPLEIYKEFAFLQPKDWYDRNLAMDSYLLGNLMTFYFTGLNMTALIKDEFAKVGLSPICTLIERKSYLDNAFYSALEKIRESIHYADFVEPIVSMISELCNPDPTKRNDPKTLSEAGSNYALYRYITKLDFLSKKASVKLKKDGGLNR